MRLTALCLLLSACATIPRANLSTEDRLAVDTFKTAWQEAGRGSLRACYVDQARVLHTTDRMQFVRACGAYPENVAACISQEVVRTKSVPRVVLRPLLPSIDTTGGPVVHELIHWGASCTRMFPGTSNTQDVNHEDKRLWRAAPGSDEDTRNCSVQGRARSMLYPEGPTCSQKRQ